MNISSWYAYVSAPTVMSRVDGSIVSVMLLVSFASTRSASSTTFATSASSRSKNGARAIPIRKPLTGCLTAAT